MCIDLPGRRLRTGGGRAPWWERRTGIGRNAPYRVCHPDCPELWVGPQTDARREAATALEGAVRTARHCGVGDVTPYADSMLGEALCARCYDYKAAVLFNASVSELWRRTTIYTVRALGNLAGLSVRNVAKELRLSYVKVVELQRRGSVHLHALVRLDAKDEDALCPTGTLQRSTACSRVRARARGAYRHHVPALMTTVGVPSAMGQRARPGDCDRRATGSAQVRRGSWRNTPPSRPTSTACSTTGCTPGLPDGVELPSHLRNLVEAAWRLGGIPVGRELNLRAWAHAAGYRGHFLTKSRRFSTTFAELRVVRREWRLQEKRCGEMPSAEHGLGRDTDGVVGEWRFDGMGYTTVGDTWLAESIAEEERLARRFAYEERRDAWDGSGATIVDRPNREPQPAADLISVPEAARRIGLHADTLYRLCRSGHFPPAIQIGSRWRVSVPRLERYLHGDTNRDQRTQDEGRV